MSYYIQQEIEHQAMYGPFNTFPFTCHISPFMTRIKQNSDKRRVIVDLSWPQGNAVNAGVKPNQYLGTYFDQYPSVDNIADTIKKVGENA